MNDDSINRVMIRVPNWVGDAVMAVPALREFRRIFGSQHITLAAKPWVSGLFDGEDLADDVLELEQPPSGPKGFREFVRAVRAVRRRQFDLAILLPNSFGAALLARSAGVPNVTGYPTDGRRLLLNSRIPLPPHHRKRHQAHYYLNLAAEVERKIRGTTSVSEDRVMPRLHASELTVNAGRLFLAAHGVSANASLAVINPGATNSRAKQWPAARFTRVADNLADDGYHIVIIGTAGDLPAARETASLMRARPAILAGKTTIAELKAVVACSSVMISNDTGAAHLSAALGIPTVIIFGPTEHHLTRPLSDAATIVRCEVFCSPCMLRDCPIDHRCMTGVAAGAVYDEARKMILSAAEENQKDERASRQLPANQSSPASHIQVHRSLPPISALDRIKPQ